MDKVWQEVYKEDVRGGKDKKSWRGGSSKMKGLGSKRRRRDKKKNQNEKTEGIRLVRKTERERNGEKKEGRNQRKTEKEDWWGKL